MENNFENLMREYEIISEKLDDENLPLEKSIELYKESIEIYNKLQNIINNYKIEITNLRDENV